MKVKARFAWDPASTPSFWINHASRLLMRSFEQRLRPLGFGVAYFPVIRALEEGKALLQKDLAERAHVEQPTMAALLARMERDGLVTRKPHPADKRAAAISLTPKARGAFPAALESLRPLADRLTNGFSDEERRVFLSLLKRAVTNLESVEP